MEERLPSVFVSHGAPSLAIEPSETRDFLARLGAALPRPKAIVCMTAHWETVTPAVGGASHPATIHDFYGFPPELYRVQYPAPGAPDLAKRVAQRLEAAVDPARGLDHGVWAPLILMYPDAAIPVIPVAVQPQRDAAHHYALGAAARGLREEGVLVLGSGSVTHNLRELGSRQPHAVAFDAWVCDAVTHGRVDDLIRYRELAPEPLRNHPTPEHFLPVLFALGAASDPAGEVRNHRFEYGSLSMAAFTWS